MPIILTVYGTGKGKTTNAIGSIFNAVLRKKRVIVGQFLKTGQNCGECNFFSSYKEIKWFCFGEKDFYYPPKNQERFRKMVQQGVKKLLEELEKDTVDLLVLDEGGLAIEYNLLALDELKKLFSYVKEKIIITGRIIPSEILDIADEKILIQEIKHPYQQGIKARKGIDF
ncbi:MAG: cob(I)yrinic acid a,c-diamide adenosyltransferase [Candidatus Heimdallarchaeaceae archaeon]